MSQTNNNEVNQMSMNAYFINGTWRINVRAQDLNFGYSGDLDIVLSEDETKIASAVITFDELWPGQKVEIVLSETSIQMYEPQNIGLGAAYKIYVLTLYGYNKNYSAEFVLTFNTGSIEYGYVSGTASIWSYETHYQQYNGAVSGKSLSMHPSI